MQSTNIIFPAPNQVVVHEEHVPAPGPGEVLCEAEVSLISTGYGREHVVMQGDIF